MLDERLNLVHEPEVGFLERGDFSREAFVDLLMRRLHPAKAPYRSGWGW